VKGKMKQIPIIGHAIGQIYSINSIPERPAISGKFFLNSHGYFTLYSSSGPFVTNVFIGEARDFIFRPCENRQMINVFHVNGTLK
jgi:hypothetical protein